MSDSSWLPFTPDDLPAIVDAPSTDPRGGTLEERAQRFHERNPSVYGILIRMARGLRARSGIKHYSIKALWEVLRFQGILTHGDIYKLNNNYHAFYARLIMRQEPDLDGFFSLRESKYDSEYYQKDKIE